MSMGCMWQCRHSHTVSHSHSDKGWDIEAVSPPAIKVPIPRVSPLPVFFL